MTEKEIDKLFKTYLNNKRRIKQLSLKVAEMQRSLKEANGGLNFSEVRGNSKTKAERFADLLDMQDKYIIELEKNEKACERIYNIIKKITNDDEEASEQLKITEDVLIYYYINHLSIVDIMVQTNYSRPTIFRLLKKGRKIIAKLFKDFTYTEVHSTLYQTNFKKVNNDTQLDKLVC